MLRLTASPRDEIGEFVRFHAEDDVAGTELFRLWRRGSFDRFELLDVDRDGVIGCVIAVRDASVTRGQRPGRASAAWLIRL